MPPEEAEVVVVGAEAEAMDEVGDPRVAEEVVQHLVPTKGFGSVCLLLIMCMDKNWMMEVFPEMDQSVFWMRTKRAL